jgi:DNA polymerase-3 subunit alpha
MGNIPVLDTCTEVTANLLKLPGGRGGKFKLPTLTELHQYLFDTPFAEAHNATADVEATTRCFLELVRREIFTKEELDVPAEYFTDFQGKNQREIELIGLRHINLKEASDKIRQQFGEKKAAPVSKQELSNNKQLLVGVDFVHLHNHTQFSVLQSTISVASLVKSAVQQKMPAVAITDHANLMGAFHFVRDILNHNKAAEAKNKTALENGQEATEVPIKPIVGCEFYICEMHKDKSRKDNGYQVVLLAKNKNGYHNLAKMSSIAYTEGFYYVPRIDKASSRNTKKTLLSFRATSMARFPTSCSIWVKIRPKKHYLVETAIRADLYIELMRHNQEDENRVNEGLIHWPESMTSSSSPPTILFTSTKPTPTHTIFCCAYVTAKTKYTNRSRPWLSFWFAQPGILFQIGRRNETIVQRFARGDCQLFRNCRKDRNLQSGA